MDAGTVIATHLNHIISTHAAELFGRQEVQQLLDLMSKESPKLIEVLPPSYYLFRSFKKVLQNLLTEGVHIRDMRSIFETLAEHGAHTQDADELTSLVRVKLGRAIVQQLFPTGSEVTVMTLENNLERLLMQAVQNNTTNDATLEPGMAETLSHQAASAAKQQEQLGMTPVLLVPSALRAALSKFLRRTVPHLRVLSHEELPDF